MLYDEFLHLPSAPTAPAHNLGMFSGQHNQGFIKSVDVRRCQITDGIGKFQQQRLWRTGQLVIHAHEGVRRVQGDRAVFRTKPTFNMERRPRMVHFILGKTTRVLGGRAQRRFVQETWTRIEHVHHHESQRAPNRGVRAHPGTKHIVRRINP